MPWAGGVATATLVETPVIALATSSGDVVLAGTLKLLGPAVGAGGFTVMLTVAGVEVPPVPVAVYVKLSVPTYPAAGV